MQTESCLCPRTVTIRRLFFRWLHLVVLVLLVIIIYRHFLASTGSVATFNIVADPASGSDGGIGPSKELVVSCLPHDDTSWIGEHLPGWNTSIYVVGDPHAKLTVLVNKGRESMVYLT